MSRGHDLYGLTTGFVLSPPIRVRQPSPKAGVGRAIGPVVDELGQHVGQICFRIDAVQLAALDLRGQHRPVFRAFVAAGAQSILSAESNRADCALDSVGIDLDAAVIEEAHQPVPTVERIADGPGDRRTAGNRYQGLLEPGLSVSASGLLFYCRTARRSSALLPRISPSIS
jgi:hypothetical protein